MSSKRGAEWSSILLFGHPADKKKVPARLATAVTVLFLIIAGSPLADVNSIASGDSNPYSPVGTIVVNTNNAASTFTLTGPAIFTGSGTTWTQTDAPVGDYLITYNSIPGYDTPANLSQTIVNSGDTIAFTGTYNLSVGTIIVTTNSATATFTITGPATYSGSGTSWSQSNAPAGTYTITYDSVTGYNTLGSDSKTIVNSGDTIAFIGTYNPSTGTISVTTNNAASAFTISGPATYSGSGLTFSQTNAPLGTYTVTYGSIAGYDTPASEILTLGSDQTIISTGMYTKSIYSVTLQASADAYISDQQQNNNYNTSEMRVESYYQGTGRNIRSLIRFDTLIIPVGSSIISATLNINAGTVPGETRTYQVYSTTTPWAESVVTWNTQPSVTSTATSSSTSPGWMGWTVTSDVQGWVNGNNNYGWQIRDQTENSNTQFITAFHSRENPDPNLRPSLVIQYTIV